MTMAKPSLDHLGPPPIWTPPRWLSQRDKRTAQWFAAQLAAKAQSLEAENAALRAELEMYRRRERQEHR